MTNTKILKVSNNVTIYEGGSYGIIEVEKLKEMLNNLPEGITEIAVDSWGYDDPWTWIYYTVSRDETPEEYESRLKKVLEYEESSKQKKYEQYLELKALFESGLT